MVAGAVSISARTLAVAALLSLAPWLIGCESVLGAMAGPEVQCGRFEGPKCDDLIKLGRDAVAARRPGEVPLIVAVDGACPPNARCMASVLGGEDVAVIVRWPDGTMDWATIPLPADWPAGSPGAAVAQDGLPPQHLQSLVGAGG